MSILSVRRYYKSIYYNMTSNLAFKSIEHRVETVCEIVAY